MSVAAARSTNTLISLSRSDDRQVPLVPVIDGRIAFGSSMAPVCGPCLAVVNAKEAWTARTPEAIPPSMSDTPVAKKAAWDRAWRYMVRNNLPTGPFAGE